MTEDERQASIAAIEATLERLKDFRPREQPIMHEVLDCERWARLRTQSEGTVGPSGRQKDFGAEGLVYRVHYQNAPDAPVAAPPTVAGDDWNRWCQAHVLAGLEQLATVMTKETGAALAVIRKQLRDEFEQKLAELRTELSAASDKSASSLRRRRR